MDAYLHPDWSSVDGGNYGIPYNIVDGGTPHPRCRVPMAGRVRRRPLPDPGRCRRSRMAATATCWPSTTTTCVFYELFAARYEDGQWHAGVGCHLGHGLERVAAQGLDELPTQPVCPSCPAWPRCDEVEAGAIRHALRFTAPRGAAAPSTPLDTSSDSNSSALPPMGASSAQGVGGHLGLRPPARVVLRALSARDRIADNGSPWFVTGAPEVGWDDDDLRDLRQIIAATSRSSIPARCGTASWRAPVRP